MRFFSMDTFWSKSLLESEVPHICAFGGRLVLGEGVARAPKPATVAGFVASLQSCGHSLGIVSLSALQQYEKLIERLTLHWPQAWGLIALADDKGRAERLEKLRRGVIVDLQAGRPIPLDWDENNPWSVCFKLLAKDDNFWSEQVRHPACALLAAGGRGAPVAPSDIIAAPPSRGHRRRELPEGGST